MGSYFLNFRLIPAERRKSPLVKLKGETLLPEIEEDTENTVLDMIALIIVVAPAQEPSRSTAYVFILNMKKLKL